MGCLKLEILKNHKRALGEISKNPPAKIVRIDHFLRTKKGLENYYPFGMAMEGRLGSVGNYRYGFNGMEKDDEVKGVGNSYTTEFRQYDSRVCRWLSLAPLFRNFPWQSPYVAFDNNPVLFNDPLGLSAEGGSKPKKSKKGKFRTKSKYKKSHNLKGGQFAKGPDGVRKKKLGKMTITASIGHGLRKAKNWGQRTFGMRESKVQSVNLGRWISTGWIPSLSETVSGNTVIYNHLNMPPCSRLTGIRTLINRGDSPFKNFNYVSVKGYGPNGFKTRFASPGLSTSIIPSLQDGNYYSGAYATPLPLMNVAFKYFLAKLNLGAFGGSLPPVNFNPGQSFGVTMLLDRLNQRMNPAFRNTRLLQIDIKTAGTIKIMQEIKYMHMVHREPNWFQKVFMMNY